MRKFLPLWLVLAYLRIMAQVRCGRCMACPWCEEIKTLEGEE